MPKAPKVGFIGLGNMGRGISRRLVDAGVDLIVFDINPVAVEDLERHGASSSSDVQEIASQASVIFTSLPGPSEIEQTVFGEEGIVNNIRKDATLIDLSTISRELVLRVDHALRERGAHMLDAPVSGGKRGAESGELAVWVGGEEEIFKRHADLLAIVGNLIRHVGPIGAGTAIKLAHNAAAYTMLASVGEMFSMAVKAGVDPLTVWEAISDGGAGRVHPLYSLTTAFLSGEYTPATFRLQLAHKDVALAATFAKEVGVNAPILELTEEVMAEAIQRGFGDEADQAFLKLQLQRDGTEFNIDDALLKTAIQSR